MTPIYSTRSILPVFRIPRIFLFGLLTFIPVFSTAQISNRADLQDVFGKIGRMIDSAHYTQAHEEAVKNIYSHQEDTTFVCFMYFLLSDIERVTDHKEASMQYLRKCGTIISRMKPATSNSIKTTYYQRLANLYYETGENDSAYVYARMSILQTEKYSPSTLLPIRMLNLPIIGHYHYLKGDYAEAERIYNEVLDTLRAYGQNCTMPIIYIKLADVKLETSGVREAIRMAEEGFREADACDLTQYKLAALHKLTDWYVEIKDYKKAAENLQMKMDLLDEIHYYDQKNQVQELETKFETKLKEAENASLKALNKKQEIQNRQQLIILVLSGIVLVIVLIFAIAFFGQNRRIAKQKAAVDKLNLLNQKIFSVISHDFKGPMLGIEMLLSMHEKYGMNAETFTNQTIQLRNDLKQANLIMENLLNWSKTELGFSSFQKQASDVSTVSEEVTAQLQSLLTQKNLRVRNHIPAGNELPVPPDILKIIFRNLLSNAIKFSREGEEITLAYTAGDNHYSVKDNGIGMTEEQVKRLFQGMQDSRLGTHRESGYGIGLNIVAELVRKYNGSIWVESKINEGTTVYFRFK